MKKENLNLTMMMTMMMMMMIMIFKVLRVDMIQVIIFKNQLRKNLIKK